VIEFVLDGRSKVNTYVQLVQQVKQALRVGLLRPGDQLPKVRDVAQALAINPNTVLKAYRELEIEGLAEGRPGVGTFIRTTIADAALTGAGSAEQAELRADLTAWLGRARTAGLTREDVLALVETTMRAAPEPWPDAPGQRQEVNS
jgi:DNA-binding transcriptional regulator YhcF (GntR family)